MEHPVLLEMRGISKTFPGVKAQWTTAASGLCAPACAPRDGRKRRGQVHADEVLIRHL